MRLSPLVAVVAAGLALASPASAGPFSFSTGNVDGRIATASRPASAGKIEIETGDDFVLGSETIINRATFTGLLPAGAALGEVKVEIYRVFPLDSDTNRMIHVLTRVNSPSDVEFADRSTAVGTLSFSTAVLNTSFTAANSVVNNINPFPNQTTGGEGAVTGVETLFTADFTSPFDLPAGHYFFVPHVEVVGAGDFLWLSSVRPIVPPGTPFPPGFTDLQSWIRNDNLAPDWSRIGTDIVGGATPPTFNATFSLDGQAVPEPSTFALLGAAAVGLAGYRRWRRSTAA
jgi:hypothetical protein